MIHCIIQYIIYFTSLKLERNLEGCTLLSYHSFCEVTRVCLTWRALKSSWSLVWNRRTVCNQRPAGDFVGMKNDDNETCSNMVFGLRQFLPTCCYPKMACKNRVSCQDITLHREDQQKGANKLCQTLRWERRFCRHFGSISIAATRCKRESMD